MDDLYRLANFIAVDIIDGVLVPLLFSVAFIVFLWGVYNFFIVGGNNEEKRKEGRTYVIYGVVGFFIMLSIWGIVRVFVGTFGFDSATRPDLPRFDNSFNPNIIEAPEPIESSGNPNAPLLVPDLPQQTPSQLEPTPTIVEPQF